MVFGNLFPHRLEPINSTKGLFYSGRIGFLPVKKRRIYPTVTKSSSSTHKEPEKNKFRSVAEMLYRSTSKIFITNIPEDAWTLKEYGGVKMWVNESTGEVSIANPNKEKSPPPSLDQEPIDNKDCQSVDGLSTAESSQIGHGITRISIYSSENEEVQEAFDILDPKFTFKQVILHQISPFK